MTPPTQEQKPPALLTYEQAAQQMGITVRQVRREVRRGRLPAYPLGLRNGRVVRGVPAATVEKAGMLTPVLTRPPTVSLTPEGFVDVVHLRSVGYESQADEYERRMAAVARWWAKRRSTPYGEQSALRQQVAAEFGVSPRTLRRWEKQLREGGPAALVPSLHSTKASTSLPEDLQLQLREFWLNSRRPTYAQAYRCVALPFYKELGEDPCCQDAVASFLKNNVLPLEKAYFRDGPKNWEAEFAPKIVRELPPPGEVWSSDFRQLDVLCLVPDGKGGGWGKHGRLACPCGSGRERRHCCSLRRPWVAAILDVGSAAIVGLHLCLRATAADVAVTIRQAILAFGAPVLFQSDWGKAFTAHRISGKDRRRLENELLSPGVWRLIGVRLTRALPYHAWSKPVESIFAAFFGAWENLCPGWTGRDARQRPEQLDSQLRNGLILSLAELAKVTGEKREEWNTDYVCGRRPAPPLALYKQQWEKKPPVVPSEQSLLFLLQEVREVKIGVYGIELQHAGQTYRYNSAELAVLIGLKRKIRWSPEDPDMIYVYSGTKVLAVPRAGKGAWGGWGETNEEAARGRRLQKEYLKARAAEMRGATPLERLDPTGAVKLIQERQARLAAEEKERAERQERADRFAAEEARRQAEARRRAQEQPHRIRTAYDDIIEEMA